MLRTFKPTNDATVTISVEASSKMGHRLYWKYSFWVNEKLIFEGEDLSTYYTRTEEEAMRDLIDFLTTECDGERYTKAQLDWLNSYACEALSIEAE